MTRAQLYVAEFEGWDYLLTFFNLKSLDLSSITQGEPSQPTRVPVTGARFESRTQTASAAACTNHLANSHAPHRLISKLVALVNDSLYGLS